VIRLTVDTFKNLKIRKIEIKNYKLFDDITIDFPPPQYKGDPDVMVLGSRNGQGKTSVMEAMALSYIALTKADPRFISNFFEENNLDDQIIKAGKNEATIKCEFSYRTIRFSIQLTIPRGKAVKISSEPHIDPRLKEAILNSQANQSFLSMLEQALGLRMEPLIAPYFTYMHSFRKTPEGKPELDSLTENNKSRSRYMVDRRSETSRFKTEVIRYLMGSAGLFEGMENSKNQTELEMLNSLVEKYANGSIHKLKPQPYNTLDILIKPINGGNAFSFDGLSSGQKEIITTLFTIWQNTKDNPGIVMIDEPELHLNSIWHKEIVGQLFKICPENQYILATHSEQIFNSVDPERRIILKQQV
jgi:predicted ATP-binding protein involved in virulence